MSETRRFPRQILVRLSDELATAIDTAAKTRGISSAAWLRTLAAESVAGAVPQDRQRSPRRGPRPDLSAAEEELRRLVRTLGVVGGAAVQLTKALREGGHPEHGEAERTLKALKRAAGETANLVWKNK